MDYSILRYGAVADGVTNCAAAIQQAAMRKPIYAGRNGRHFAL